MWTELATSQDFRRQKTSKLHVFSLFAVLSCLDSRNAVWTEIRLDSNQFPIYVHIADGNGQNYWKLSETVANSVHTTRRDSLVLSMSLVWTVSLLKSHRALYFDVYFTTGYVSSDWTPFLTVYSIPFVLCIENLNSPEIHPVANNMREHREKLN